MYSWLQYLAFLKWQNQKLCLKDFENTFQNKDYIRNPYDLSELVCYPETRMYIKNKKHWWKEVEKDSSECKKLKIKTTWPFHPDYPHSLLYMDQLPPLISWRGQACWKNKFLFSVVGSRKAYNDTLLWMDIHLSAFLQKKKKICLVSGGARGVDQKAHVIALANQNPTLCFLPCGLKHYYPSELEKWVTPIIEGGGAFISVFPLSSEIKKSHFHARNAVMARLSHLIFIAQAEIRSGSMITARYALHAGVNLCALPGGPLYAGYKGNLSLLNDGCFMIRDSMDLETLYQSSCSQIRLGSNDDFPSSDQMELKNMNPS